MLIRIYLVKLGALVFGAYMPIIVIDFFFFLKDWLLSIPSWGWNVVEGVMNFSDPLSACFHLPRLV